MAKKSIGIENVKVFPRAAMRKVAEKHIGKFKHRVGDKGQDYRGRVMPAYSEKYATYKSEARHGGDTQVHPPNFRLSGRTLRALYAKKFSTDYYTIGWDGEPAKIVDGNRSRKKKRDIATNIPDKEKEYVARELTLVMEREFKKKLKNVRITVNV